jgi:hypothetical protein
MPIKLEELIRVIDGMQRPLLILNTSRMHKITRHESRVGEKRECRK